MIQGGRSAASRRGTKRERKISAKAATKKGFNTYDTGGRSAASRRSTKTRAHETKKQISAKAATKKASEKIV
jgi:hypothetical protein